MRLAKYLAHSFVSIAAIMRHSSNNTHAALASEVN